MAKGKLDCRMLLQAEVLIFMIILVPTLSEEVNKNSEENLLKEAKAHSSQVDCGLVFLEVVHLRRDIRRSEETILEKLSRLEKSPGNIEKEKDNLKKQVQSLATELSDTKRELSEELKRLNKIIGDQNDEILDLQKAVENRKIEENSIKEDTDNLTGAYQTLLQAFRKLEKSQRTHSESIVNDVCKARSIEMADDCNTTECCLKSAFEQYDKCFPSCSGKCPADYNLYKEGNFCYKFHTQCKDWSSARSTCQKEGGDLIMLKDDKSVEYFMTLAKEKHGGCMKYGPWIGANDAAKEGDWRWVDGTKFMMNKHWISGEPNGGKAENYMHLHHPTNYHFNDASHGLGGTSFICAIQ